ncbi:MAG: rhomboid family intramembrane serine protease [Thermoprotei archaeon]|nr:MAG: rhomboid family intramembrane serine protease [Thermoprotei archaeon]
MNSMIPIGEIRRKKKVPIMTWMLIIVNVAIFVYCLLKGPAYYGGIIQKYGMVPYDILCGRRLHTIITSMFLHGGLMHLIGNMMFLLIFGPGVESRIGRTRFMELYLGSGIVASFAHIVILLLFSEPIIVYGPFGYSEIDPLKIPCIGASGAISGLLGAYMVLLPNVLLDVLTMIGPIPMIIRIPAAVFIFFWFLYQLYMGTVSISFGFYSGVAFWAHIGGFIAGLVMAPSLGKEVRRKRRVRVDYAGRIWYEVPVK